MCNPVCDQMPPRRPPGSATEYYASTVTRRRRRELREAYLAADFAQEMCYALRQLAGNNERTRESKEKSPYMVYVNGSRSVVIRP